MKKVVTVNSVVHNVPKERRDGKEYRASVIGYTDGGIDREISFPTAFLDKNTTLRDQVHAVKPDTQVELTLEKQGLYWNTTAITAPGANAPSAPRASAPRAKASSGGDNARGSFADNAAGMQVGNALTNAAALLAAGVMKGSLESAAIEVLKLGESLKKRLVAGEFAESAKAKVEKVVVDADLPFGD